MEIIFWILLFRISDEIFSDKERKPVESNLGYRDIF